MHGGVDCGLSGQYSGSWSVERVETGEKKVLTRKLTLTWSEHFDGRYWEISSAGGTFSCSAAGEYGEGGCKGESNPTRSSCSGTLSLAAGAAAAFRETQVEHYDQAGVGGFGVVPYISHDDPGNPRVSGTGSWYVSISPPVESTLLLPKSLRYEEFLHSSETEPRSPCASSATERVLGSWTVPRGAWADSFGGSGCHYVGGEVGIDWLSFPAGSSHTATDSCSGSATEGDTKGTATLAQSVTFSSPGSGSGPPGGGVGKPRPAYGPEFARAKSEAFRDMREEAIPNAARYCLPAAGALGLGGAGVLTVGLGSAGGILAVAGSLTAATLGAFCTATITRLAKDYKAYKDPPLWSIHVLARPAAVAASALPACNYPEPIAGVCTSLRGADAGLLAAAQRVAGITTAIEQTVSREHAAHSVGNRSAIAAQDANLRTLKRERSAARAAERAAGLSVAHAMSAARIGFRMSMKLSARAIALAERDARRQGITAASLRAVNRAALKPSAANLLADLERL